MRYRDQYKGFEKTEAVVTSALRKEQAPCPGYSSSYQPMCQLGWYSSWSSWTGYAMRSSHTRLMQVSRDAERRRGSRRGGGSV